MSTTQEDVRGWILRAIDERALWLVVACDTFDHSDYPIFCHTAEATVKAMETNDSKRIMEVYDLSISVEYQINENRAWHPPGAPLPDALRGGKVIAAPAAPIVGTISSDLPRQHPTERGFYWMDHYVPHLGKRVVSLVKVGVKDGEAKLMIVDTAEASVIGKDPHFTKIVRPEPVPRGDEESGT